MSQTGCFSEVCKSIGENEQLLDKIWVLDVVGDLQLIDELQMATAEQVAKYYGVPVDTIQMCVSRNRRAIEASGFMIKTRSELLNKGVFLSAKRGGFDVLDDNGEVIASGSNKGISLFPKRTILCVGMLLRDSEVADMVRDELGLSCNAKLDLRKEVEFLTVLEKQLRVLGITRFERQYSKLKCGNYRIDLYLPEINVAIEYDENGHKGYTYEAQELRQELIERELGCKFIRVGDDKDHVTNSAIVIRELILHNLLNN